MHTDTLVAEKVAAALKALGRSRKAVAQALVKAGCKGEPSSTVRCPVAVYLRRKTGLTRTLDVGNSHVYIRGVICAKNPRPVSMLISAFDRGEFPELEKKKRR